MRTCISNIGQLVTGTPGRKVEVCRDASLVFENSLIVYAGSSNEFDNPAENIVDANGGVVLPGFVDAHTHLIFGGNRSRELALRARGASYADIKSQGGGILSTVRNTRELSPEEMLERGMLHLTWCLRGGTTTIEAKSGYGLDRSTELDILLAYHQLDQMLATATSSPDFQRIFPTFLGLHAVPEESNSAQEYVEIVTKEILPVIANTGLAKYVDAFVEPGYFEAIHARELAKRAHEFGLELRLHVDQLSNSGGAQLAAELGAVTADHLEMADAQGIAALRDSNTMPVLLPASVFGLGLSRYPAARDMIDAGLPVILATDFNPGSSPTPSIPFVMALACRYMGMTPEECLVATTINATRSLGLSDRGQLKPGMLADFSIWQLHDWQEVMQWIDGPRPVSVWASGTKVIG